MTTVPSQDGTKKTAKRKPLTPEEKTETALALGSVLTLFVVEHFVLRKLWEWFAPTFFPGGPKKLSGLQTYALQMLVTHVAISHGQLDEAETIKPTNRQYLSRSIKRLDKALTALTVGWLVQRGLNRAT